MRNTKLLEIKNNLKNIFFNLGIVLIIKKHIQKPKIIIEENKLKKQALGITFALLYYYLLKNIFTAITASTMAKTFRRIASGIFNANLEPM